MNRKIAILILIVVLLIAILTITGCAPSVPDNNVILNEPFTDGRVFKFDDGSTRCYVYVGFGISCVERSQ